MYRKYKYKKSGNTFSASVKCNGKLLNVNGVIPESVPMDFEQDYINLQVSNVCKKMGKREKLLRLDATIGGGNNAILSHAQRR